MEKKLEEVINRLDALKEEIARLETVVAELRAAEPVAVAVPAEEIADLSEPIDLTLADEDFEAAAPVPSGTVPQAEVEIPEIESVTDDLPAPEDLPVPEEVPAATVSSAEDLPAPEYVPVEEPTPVLKEEETPFVQEREAEDGDGFFGLFGEEISPVRKEPRGRRHRESIAEATVAPRTVADALEANAAWRTDMPGPEVKSLRSAIALGDQVLFIARLFRKDSALYQDTVDRLNATPTLAEALSYLSETFPEWDLASDDVYKFMMAVRRKIRR